MKKKKLLKAIKPHALERLYLVTRLYENKEITKEEYFWALQLIYKSRGLFNGEHILRDLGYRSPYLSEYIFDSLYIRLAVLKKHIIGFVHRITANY